MRTITFLDKETLNVANFISLVAIVLWVFSTVLFFSNQLLFWSVLMLIAFLLDILDGFVARKINILSKTWALLDVIADVFIYIMPIVALALWQYNVSVVMVFCVAIFIVASVIRLAVFATRWFETLQWARYYIWLPVYFSHLLFLVLLLHWGVWLLNGLMLIFSFLMVSKIQIKKQGMLVSLIRFAVLSGCVLYIIIKWL